MTDKKNCWTDADVGLLILRVALGGLIIFHGIAKIQHGLDDQMGFLAAKGIPTFFMYFVYISEIVAPVLIVLGIFTRLSALSIAITLVVVFFVAPFPLMALDIHGAWAIEVQILYFLIPLALFFTGPGRFCVRKNSGHWMLD